MSDKKIPDEMREQLENTEESDENDGPLDNVEHDLDTEELELLDPKLIEKIQENGREDMFVEFDGSGGKGEERLDIVRKWFSEENDYKPDTNISPQQVYAMTLMRNVDNMIDTADLSETQSYIDDVLNDLEKYMLSIEGFARNQEENVLRSIFGGGGEMAPTERDSMFAKMLSNPPENKED